MTSIDTSDLRVAARVKRLNAASARHVIEPDVEITGHVTKSQIIPDDLLSIAGLDCELTPAQRAVLSREEVASIARFGILLESVLMAGFGFRLALSPDVTDPRFVYALHEIGEETRHSRLFIRLVDELAPKQRDLFNNRAVVGLRSRAFPLLLRRPATLDALVLAGEEIPDLLQKLAAEHPETDEHVRAISRYHRAEEARHLAYARATISDHYRNATLTDRFAVRWIVPVAIVVMFDTIVQPSVYPTVGLPALQTWLRVRRLPTRVALRQQCARSVLDALVDAGILDPVRIPLLWRHVSGVEGTGPLRSLGGPRRAGRESATRLAGRALDLTLFNLARRLDGRPRTVDATGHRRRENRMFIQVIHGSVTDPDLLERQEDRWHQELRPGATGYLGATSGVTPDGRGITIARFVSEQAARANSERREQGEWWSETEKAFRKNVTFRDCRDVDLILGGPSDDAGFVQIFEGRAKDQAQLRARVHELESRIRDDRPDILGMLVAWHGDGGGFTQAVYFTSEVAARRDEQADQPDRDEMMALMDGPLTFFDLPEPNLD